MWNLETRRRAVLYCNIKHSITYEAGERVFGGTEYYGASHRKSASTSWIAKDRYLIGAGACSINCEIREVAYLSLDHSERSQLEI
jgi:hypothetical protein